MVMLENPKLILTVTLPDFLLSRQFPNLEAFYSQWVNDWVAYGDRDWVAMSLKRVWEDCDDLPDSVSQCHYAEELLLTLTKSLEKHFNETSREISYHKLPHQIHVKPLGLKGVVLWTIQ